MVKSSRCLQSFNYTGRRILLREQYEGVMVVFLRIANGKMELVEKLPEIKGQFVDGLLYAESIQQLPDGNRKVRLAHCTLFDTDEVEDILGASIVLERLFDNLFRLDAAREAFNEFEQELNSFCSNDSFAIATVDRRFRAYVFEWKCFLDHWKKYIDDGAQTKYWSNQAERKKFIEAYIEAYKKFYKDVTEDGYDNCEEYVLATAIRNHVVHANKSVYSYNISPSGNKVYIHRDALLSETHIGKSQRELIEKQEQKIDLYIVAKKSLEAAEKVMGQLMNFQIDNELVCSSQMLINAFDKIQSEGIRSEIWMIAKIEDLGWEQSLEHSIVATGVKDEHGNPVSGKPIKMPLMFRSANFLYQYLNWQGYLAVAVMIGNLFKSGEWQRVQKKYLGEVLNDIGECNQHSVSG